MARPPSVSPELREKNGASNGADEGVGTVAGNSRAVSPQMKIIAAVAAKDRIIERQALVMNLATAVLGETETDKALQRVMDATYHVVNCERVSIFLLKNGEVVCKAAPAGGKTGWSIPIGKGIAGHVAATGNTLNIPDAYQCPELFDPSHDRATGFRTRSILCMPMRSFSKEADGRHAEVIGVLQAINKRPSDKDGGANGSVHFDATDERLMALLLALTSEQLRVTELVAESVTARTFANTMMELLKTLCSRRELDDAVRALAEATRTLAGCQQVFIFLRQTDGSLVMHGSAVDVALEIRSYAGRGVRVEASDKSVVGRVARSHRPALLSCEKPEERRQLLDLVCRLREGSDDTASPVAGGPPPPPPPTPALAFRTAACVPLLSDELRQESEAFGEDQEEDLLGVVLLVNKRGIRPKQGEEVPGTAEWESFGGPEPEMPRSRRSLAEIMSPSACASLPTGGSRVDAYNVILDAVQANSFEGVVSFEEADVNRLDAPLLLAAQLVKTARLYNQEKRANRKLAALLTLIPKASAALESRDVQEVVQLISTHALEMFECDRCTFFTVDHFTNALVGHYALQSGELQEFRVPIGVGIVGHVASTGELLNIKDAWSDARFSNKHDLESGYRTHTILCAPLKASNGKVIAVLQCINKRYHEHFGEEDESLLTTCSILLSDLLQRTLHQSSFGAFIQSSDEIDSEIKDMFREFYTGTDMGGTSDGNSGHSRAIIARTQTMGSCRLSDSTADASFAYLSSWAFDHASFHEAHGQAMLFHHIEQMLGRFDLWRRFRLPTESLTAYISALRSSYSTQAAYHNWAHAFSTLHAAFLLLISKAFSRVLPTADVLGLLLAAPGHDAGHPGRTNAFQMATESKLAIRYNDTSVLENHHAAVTCGLLRRGEPTNVLAVADAAMTRRVRQVIVASILGTDMAKHSECIAWLDSSNLDLPGLRAAGDGKGGSSLLQAGSDQALKLTTAVLHAADVSHPVLPWAMHKRGSLQVAEEFYSQFQEEQRLGLPTLPFMGKDPKDLRALAPVQVGFLQFVVTPLWSALNFAAGEDLLGFTVENLDRNRQLWQRTGDGEDVSDEQPFTNPVGTAEPT